MRSTLDEAIRHLERGDWQRAHAIVQDDESPLGCWAHGIVHLLEGDVGNAHYWYRRTDRRLPATLDTATEIAALAQAVRSDRASDPMKETP
ncbi:MAG TPA: hypothetical protein VNE58_08650 [Casimicrobiaceae bacterium]|nr:hypothetical protein [Casimicrobiaceae bacterium]